MKLLSLFLAAVLLSGCGGKNYDIKFNSGESFTVYGVDKITRNPICYFFYRGGSLVGEAATSEIESIEPYEPDKDMLDVEVRP